MNAYRFSPVDTWFFKEARPMDGFGGTELSSLFPPPVRTLLGALRTAAGDARKVDWGRFPEAYPDLVERIGDAESYGQIRCRGVFPALDGQTLYPVPQHIVHLDEKSFAKMTIGDAISCDLGTVRLPRLPSRGKERYRTFDESVWIDKRDLQKILEGGIPTKIYKVKDLIARESRVGIGRKNRTRTVEEGKLYMTSHIRPLTGVEILLEVDGLEEFVTEGVCRLGGEGRAATYAICEAETIPVPKRPKGKVQGVFFSLLTLAVGVDPLRPLGETVTSACVGKSVQEGGFDMNRTASRSARSYLPPGSTWFVEMGAQEAEAFIRAHHETQIGEEQELGRGRIVCGYWTE